MDINNLRKINKDKIINIRVTSELKGWLRKKKYSPTAIFHEAVKDLRKR